MENEKWKMDRFFRSIGREKFEEIKKRCILPSLGPSSFLGFRVWSLLIDKRLVGYLALIILVSVMLF